MDSNLEASSESRAYNSNYNKRKINDKASVINVVQSMGHDIRKNLADVKDRTDQHAQATEQIREHNVVKNELEENHIKKDEAVLLLSKHLKLDGGSTESVLEGDTVTKKSKKGSEMDIKLPNESELHLSSSDVKEEQCLSEGLGKYPNIFRVIPIRRKLIVLDVNGLLAHIIMPAPKDRRADTHILGRAIFKRPFCDDFLNFCFQNFDVGIWSSRSKAIIDRVADYLLGNRKGRILFCWNMSQATQTGFQTLENRHKPLVFKELRKIWENNDPNLRWKNGDYDESNTLLLDDSPYKALLNPLHTAIFPISYRYGDINDNSLGPGGDLRVYLEGLLESDNVQNFVEQAPFGQCALNEKNPSWEFYSRVLQTMNQPTSSPHLKAPVYN